ncbi:MAG: type IV pilus twitching motility protein PilT [Patescibacteria group bacterium]
MEIQDILQMLVIQGGSDLHIVVGSPPMIRIDGRLAAVEGMTPLDDEGAKALIFPLMSQNQRDYVKVNKELDFGYQFSDQGRFRVNVYHAKGHLSAALRLIPARIKSIDELSLPPIFHQVSQFNQGLILVTGPTGEGKSTTLAAVIDEINATRPDHIVTIEDPIEFVYTPKQSVISQREINQDTNSWDISLRSVLREDPDVVLVGEMRDYETIASAITIAETGHLVFATLHTATAAQTIDRMIDVFPANQQGQIRQQLAGTIKMVVSQRLVSRVDGGRFAAFEIMVANSAIRNLIREAKAHQIDNVIQTSAVGGMMLIENHLMQLVQQGIITKDTAIAKSFRPEEMHRLLGG